MRYIYLLFLVFTAPIAFGQNVYINNFLLKESPSQATKLLVVAADSLEHPLENINGAYTFSVNGFSQVLNFKDGMSVIPLNIEKSMFLYVKHENDLGTHSRLMYIYKTDIGLKPITINRMYLIAIPIVIILLVFAIKRFIYAAVVLFVLFSVFAYGKGLNPSTYLETIFDYLKSALTGFV